MPLAHTAERALVETLSLFAGFRVHFAHALDTFMDDLRRARPTLFFSVPRLWAKFHAGICERLPAARSRARRRSLPISSPGTAISGSSCSKAMR